MWAPMVPFRTVIRSLKEIKMGIVKVIRFTKIRGTAAACVSNEIKNEVPCCIYLLELFIIWILGIDEGSMNRINNTSCKWYSRRELHWFVTCEFLTMRYVRQIKFLQHIRESYRNTYVLCNDICIIMFLSVVIDIFQAFTSYIIIECNKNEL